MIRNWEEIDRFLTARGVRIDKPTLQQTTAGKHANDPRRLSNHFLGTARDYGTHDNINISVALDVGVHCVAAKWHDR